MNIEVGQVWTLKYNAEPVCVVNIQDGFVYIDWFWETGINDCDGITIEHFLRDYEFYAQPIAYHDFKKWCMTRQNPVKQSEPVKQKHAHYYKDVSHLSKIDIYSVCRLFNVTDPEISHAVKKLLCLGQRGLKDRDTDMQNVIDTLQRWQELEREFGNG